MPHLIVEYSANLEDRISIQELINKVHQAAVSTGVFELAAIRTRAERRDAYVVADGNKDNSFVAIRVSIGKGRDEQIRHRVGKTIFDAVCNYLGNVRDVAISFELREIDPTVSFRKNGLHSILKERADKSSASNGKGKSG